MLFFKKRKIIVWVIFLLVFLLLLGVIVPYKIVLSPQLSQLAFTYDSEDFVDIKEQVSYTLGESVAKNVTLEKDTGNTVLFANKLTLLNWLKKCERNCSYIDSRGIEASESYVKIKCSKEDVPRKMIDADEFIRYYFVKQLLYGIKTDKINIKVEFVEQSTENILISAEWPKEEYNIDRDEFFNEGT